MRIALVHRDLHAITRGGLNTVYQSLASRLCAAGHDVTVLTQQSPTPVALPGIQVLPLPRTENLAAHRHAVDQVLQALHPDVVESSSWEAETLHYARRPADDRAPVVIRGDLSAATMRARPTLIEAERELLHAADQVLAVSQFAAEDLDASYDVSSTVIPNGIDRSRFCPGPVTYPATSPSPRPPCRERNRPSPTR